MALSILRRNEKQGPIKIRCGQCRYHATGATDGVRVRRLCRHITKKHNPLTPGGVK